MVCVALVYISAGCAVTKAPPPLLTEIAETPIIQAEVARRLKRVAVIVSATSRTEYEARLANSSFGFRPQETPIGRNWPITCLLPPAFIFCMAADAAIQGAADAFKNTARREQEKAVYDQNHQFLAVLAQEDLRSMVLEKLSARVEKNGFGFISGIQTSQTARDKPLELPSKASEENWDAVLLVQVSDPYLLAEPNSPDKLSKEVGLGYSATLFSTPKPTKIAEMSRLVRRSHEERMADTPQRLRIALSGSVDEMVKQIEDALIAPIALHIKSLEMAPAEGKQ